MKWVMKEPTFGDMIRVELGGIYHFGIYASDDEVIQFGLPPVSRAHLRDDEVEVLAADIDSFLAGGFLEVCEFDKKERKSNRSREETVAFAREKIGTRGYNILYNNCEHFATTCIMGKPYCSQTEQVRNLFRNMPVANVFFATLPSDDIGEALSSPEREEYVSSIRNDRVRREKYFVWKLLEYAIDRTFGIKAEKLSFRKTDCGKWITDGYCFSLSHSENMLAVAVSRGDIGVDIEKLRETPDNRMAERILCADELKEFSSLPDEDKNRFLIEKWSVKEAIFKSQSKKSFSPAEINTTDYTYKSGELLEGDETYIWSVATKTPEILKIYKNIKLI